MARKPTPRTDMLLFDVTYEDGSQRSNRRVPAALMEGLDGGEDAVKAEIRAQDAAIAEKSGVPPLEIKSIKRSGKK